jgi:hypothetical protein
MADLSKDYVDYETFFKAVGKLMRTMAALAADAGAMRKINLNRDDFPADLYLQYRQEILDAVEPALQRVEQSDAESILELLKSFEGPIQ